MSKKEQLRRKRHRRILSKVIGTDKRPRLIIHRSLKHICASVLDDTQNKTLFFLSTQDKEIKQESRLSGNIKAAEFFGEVFARKAKEKGITKIVFDRAGFLYHGRIKAFADALKKGGLEF
jgi:large subunit ribosomal protein L18